MPKKEIANQNQNNNQTIMINQMLDHLYIAHTISQKIYGDDKIEAIFCLLADSIKNNIKLEKL
jgi:hypothetical protein